MGGGWGGGGGGGGKLGVKQFMKFSPKHKKTKKFSAHRLNILSRQ